MAALIAVLGLGIVLGFVGWFLYLIVVLGIKTVWLALMLIIAGFWGVVMISTVVGVGTAMILYDLVSQPFISIGAGIFAFLVCACYGVQVLWREIIRVAKKF